MKSMTYGTLPSTAELAESINTVLDEDGDFEMSWSMHSDDWDLRQLDRLKLVWSPQILWAYDRVSVYFSATQLLELLQNLVKGQDDWTHEESAWAEEFASTIMYVLGYEWV